MVKVDRDGLHSDLRNAARVVGWTAIQVLVFVIVHQAGVMAWAVFHDIQRDLGRGLFWAFYFLEFCALALVANAILLLGGGGPTLPRRIVVWTIVLIVLVVPTLGMWRYRPLAVPLIHGCAFIAILVREGLARLSEHRQSLAAS